MLVPDCIFSDVKAMSILGAGTMGRGWIIAALINGLWINVYEVDETMVVKALKAIEGQVRKFHERQKLPPVTAQLSPEEILGRLKFWTSLEKLAANSDPILLEVVTENLRLKCDLFEQAGQLFGPSTVFWSNTSCLSVRKMAEASGRPDLMLGTHGMNPVFLMPGVEVVKHDLLDPEVLLWTCNFLATRLGKTPFISKDVPGFIVNKGFMMWAFHYIEALLRREGTVEDIDTGLKLSLGHPQGVFILMDRIGLDVMILVGDAIYEATQDPRYLTPELLRQMVAHGDLGQKSGRGFYDWQDTANPRPLTPSEFGYPYSKPPAA